MNKYIELEKIIALIITGATRTSEQPPEVFYKKRVFLEISHNSGPGLQLYENVKFLRTNFLQNTSGRLLLELAEKLLFDYYYCCCCCCHY